MDVRLIKEVSSGIWSLDPASMLALLPLATKIRNGETVDFSSVVSRDIYSGVVNSNNKVVAIIPVHSVIRKYDYCGELGLLSMERLIKNLDRDPSIEAIVFDMDSPGGSASYLSTFAQTLRGVSKPTATYVNGTCASAAYHIAACTDHIFVSSSTDMVGSIGTMIAFESKNNREGDQYTEHVIYATKSTEKNLEFEQAIKGNYKLIKSNLLDPFNDAFHAHVMACRPDMNESVLTGKICMASAAQANGLIDGIKTLEEVIEFVSAGQSTSLVEKVSNRLNKMFNKKAMAKQLTGVSAIIGRELKAGDTLTADEIAMLNAHTEQTEDVDTDETDETENVDTDETEETENVDTDETEETEEEQSQDGSVEAAVRAAIAPVMKRLDGIESKITGIESTLEMTDAEEAAEAGHTKPKSTNQQLDEWEDPNSEFNQQVRRDRERIG